MNKKIALLLGVALSGAPLFSQSSGDALTNGTKMIYSMQKNNILGSAKEMPESGYSFKPTDSVRTFGQILAHVADAQYEFCGPVNADGTKAPEVEKTKKTKDEIIAALNDAFTYCDKAFTGMTDAKGSESVSFFNRLMPKLTVLQFNNVHTSEHYGNLVTYLRMKNLVPPSSQKH